MTLSLIVAASENHVIGKGGKIPWHLPADLKHFRDLTQGHPVIMGRKTYESIGHPLPNRTNIVITRGKEVKIEGCTIVHSLEDALRIVSDSPEVFVIGGGEIYKEALPLADRIYLTRVHAIVEGDAFFPEIDPKQWREVSRERHAADAEHLYPYTFLVYERKGQLLEY